MKFLLDEHIDPRVAQSLQIRDIDAIALRDWQGGAYLGRADGDIVAAARAEKRAIVSYDVATFPLLLRRLAETGTPHAGVILVSVKTALPSDVRRLARLLAAMPERFPRGLYNQVLFLT